jgi:GTPase SAR1 family protein
MQLGVINVANFNVDVQVNFNVNLKVRRCSQIEAGSKVLLVLGFLGSGKTTFVNHLIDDNEVKNNRRLKPTDVLDQSLSQVSEKNRVVSTEMLEFKISDKSVNIIDTVGLDLDDEKITRGYLHQDLKVGFGITSIDCIMFFINVKRVTRGQIICLRELLNRLKPSCSRIQFVITNTGSNSRKQVNRIIKILSKSEITLIKTIDNYLIVDQSSGSRVIKNLHCIELYGDTEYWNQMCLDGFLCLPCKKTSAKVLSRKLVNYSLSQCDANDRTKISVDNLINSCNIQ